MTEKQGVGLFKDVFEEAFSLFMKKMVTESVK